MKKFSYKDFIDGITAKLPYDKSHSRRVSPKMVNMVWKETVKYIIAELQHNREVYLPYIGYISLKEQGEDLRVPFYKGTSKTQKVKNFDYVEFKPFKIFLDILNKMDANDDKALNKLIDRAHLNETDFVKQDYDEYMEEYLEPLYDDKDVDFVKTIVKGKKTENETLDKIINGTYKMSSIPTKSSNVIYVKYLITDTGEGGVDTRRSAERILGISLERVYQYYKSHSTQCDEDDVEINMSDIKENIKIWLLGNKEQARKKGYIKNGKGKI